MINSIQMTGRCAFAKKVARTVPLADFRFVNQKSDRVEVDLLVAADYRHRIMSMTRPLMQFNGMWLQPTIFGDYILSGPIPGPTGIIGPSKKSANIISIVNINNNLKVPLLQENEQVDNVNLSEVAK